MKPQDYPITHFDFMSRLSKAFAEMPAQLLEHNYHYEHLGSWSLDVRYSGNVIRIDYDGKEQSLAARYSRDRKLPYKFGQSVVLEYSEESGVLTEATINTVCACIRNPVQSWPEGAA